MQHCGAVFCAMLEQALIDEDRMQIPLCAVTDKIYGDMGKRHDVACLSELHFWARPFLHDGFNEAIHIHHCHMSQDGKPPLTPGKVTAAVAPLGCHLCADTIIYRPLVQEHSQLD